MPAAHSPHLVFRADGNSAIGLGHVTRCQALAQALPSAWTLDFVLREPTPALVSQLTAAGLRVRPVPPTVPPGLAEAEWLASQLTPSDVLLLDGYQFSSAYQRVATASGAALLCLDDLVTPPHWADAVLNQAGGVAAASYAAVPLASLYLGPAYALLRPAFWEPPSMGSATPRLFLNMGGADPHNYTLALLPELRRQFPGYAVVVVTGAAYPHQAALVAAAETDPAVALHHNLPASELAALLRTCQVFVCPPSGVAYECCAAGGAVLLHRTAANQQALYDFLIAEQLVLPLAEGLVLPEDRLPALAAHQQLRQRRLFDGLAPKRLRELVQQLAAEQRYQLRRATAADAARYFTWANDPAVRQNAVHPEPIAWDTHVAWFARRLADADTYLYLLAMPAGEPVGQVRIEFNGPQQPGLLDYSLAPAHRGKGLGTVLLRRALQRLRHERPALAGGAVLGQVKAGNAASARVFERLRFRRLTAVELRGTAFDQFQLDFPADF